MPPGGLRSSPILCRHNRRSMPSTALMRHGCQSEPIGQLLAAVRLFHDDELAQIRDTYRFLQALETVALDRFP